MCEGLADYAVSESSSKGRVFAEKPHPYRTGFARDRDRIIHCSAFRRLEGKTQVFMPGWNGTPNAKKRVWVPDDHCRTRLTHSIEVAQIGRTIARALGLNESLTEAICLAHDLGHSPFGHSGESVLNDLMGRFGGFEHNRQTLRVVDLLEHPYPDFVGLNLMYETRLGLAKHRTCYDNPQKEEFSEANCSLEGQAADIADRIAYNCHDLEDSMRAGLLEAVQLKDIAIFAEAQQHVKAQRIEDAAVRRTRMAKTIIDGLVSDAILASGKAIAEADVQTAEQACEHSKNLIVLSRQAEANLVEFERFLLENVYKHSFLQQAHKKVAEWLGTLFERFCAEPGLMPAYFQKLIKAEGLQRTVCDYIAGMTDRYCLKKSGEL